MGVRVISEAGHYAPAVPTYIGPFGARGRQGGTLQGRRSSVPRFTILFDGTAGKEGLAAALPANETWVDPTVLVHPGETQMGLHAMYAGPGTCKIYGAMLPSDYAQKVSGADGAALVTEASTKWETVVTLNPNVAQNLLSSKSAYTLYRIEFLTNVQAGSLTLTSV
jgi:hypothetical protein